MQVSSAKPAFDLLAVGRRVAEFRERLGLTQQQLADKVGGRKRGIQENEAGKTVAGGRLLFELALLGVNLTWLLCGAGPMLSRDLERQPPAVDGQILAGVISGVEEMLDAEGLELAVSKKSELIAVLYEQCLAEGEVKTATILRLVRLAA